MIRESRREKHKIGNFLMQNWSNHEQTPRNTKFAWHTENSCELLTIQIYEKYDDLPTTDDCRSFSLINHCSTEAADSDSIVSW